MHSKEYQIELYNHRLVPSSTPVKIKGSRCTITLEKAMSHFRTALPKNNCYRMEVWAAFSKGEWAAGLKLELPEEIETHCVGCHGPAEFDPRNKWSPMCEACEVKARAALVSEYRHPKVAA